MAGLVPAIATNNTFLSEVDGTNPAITWGSTALNGAKKAPTEGPAGALSNMRHAEPS